jgi:hypothetical protein
MDFAPQDSEDTERGDLHDKFRNLVSLLIFAVAYNCDGVPLLRDLKYPDRANDEEDTRYQKVTMSAVLSALATVFV